MNDVREDNAEQRGVTALLGCYLLLHQLLDPERSANEPCEPKDGLLRLTGVLNSVPSDELRAAFHELKRQVARMLRERIDADRNEEEVEPNLRTEPLRSPAFRSALEWLCGVVEDSSDIAIGRSLPTGAAYRQLACDVSAIVAGTSVLSGEWQDSSGVRSVLALAEGASDDESSEVDLAVRILELQKILFACGQALTSTHRELAEQIQNEQSSSSALAGVETLGGLLTAFEYVNSRLAGLMDRISE